ncbi:MAG: FAD-binding oxidoreductase [Pseudomonadota bacterium]
MEQQSTTIPGPKQPMPPATAPLSRPAFDDRLPDAVDVAIIGGGIAGVATAYYLARAGQTVAVFEKGRIAGEQSSRNWGWIRQQGRDLAELPIMMEANRLWRNLASETGDPALTFTECGVVYVAETERHMAKLEAWKESASEFQLGTKVLTPAELKERIPELEGDFAGGIVTQSDGRGEPFVAVPALARAAARHGATIHENCAVRTVETAAGRVTGVATERGTVKADRVLLAGGAWSTVLAGNQGVRLPQLAVRATVARTAPTSVNLKGNIGLSNLDLRKRADGGYTLAGGTAVDHYVSKLSFKHLKPFIPILGAAWRQVRLHPGPPKDFPGSWTGRGRWTGDDESPFERMRVLDPTPSSSALRRIRKMVPKHVPALKDVPIVQTWAGMIDTTPDAVPVLGETPEVKGFYIATGLSGHGFGIGPAIGRIMADLMQGRSAGHDLARFRPTRFTDGSKIDVGPFA